MRSIWLLPDREQTGVINAIENEHFSVVHELINVKDIPPELVLGIPEEVFRSKPDEYFLFAQFAKLQSGAGVFCLSAPSGKDASGRIVAISNLQLLDSGEMPSLKPEIPKNVNSQDLVWLEKIISTDGIENRELRKSIQVMLDAIKTSGRAKSFSSEALTLARNKPDWMPEKKNSKDIAYKSCGPKMLFVFFLIVLSVAVCLWSLYFHVN